MASVFLSYDHDDAARAAPIAAAIEHAGHSVWWDRHLTGGAEYNHEIESAVDRADAVVVLWSAQSIQSAWVRDEAAEGRDQGKLVPVLIEAVKPPMGFRQFQAIDLSRSKRGFSDTSLRPLFDSIDRLAGISRTPSPASVTGPSWRFGWTRRRMSLVAAALVLAIMATLFIWQWRAQPALAVVAVAAADTTPRSQAFSRDLVVKLGTLTQVGASKWQLADSPSAPSTADLLFRVAGSGTAAKPEASLVLLDVKSKSILWSREFAQDKGTEADLRLRLSLTSGRVLGCALEARETGGLRPDLLKLFLAGCADEAEISTEEPLKVAGTMRAIVDQQPRFTPAWARLLIADSNAVAFAEVLGSGVADARKTLTDDISKARKVAPDLLEIKLAEIDLLPPNDYRSLLDRLAQAKAQAADNAGTSLAEAMLLMRVGRMFDAIQSARRAAELDPLSPAVTTHFINVLAWGGQIDLAKEELQKAEQKWPGTGALADAQWAYHSRYGDLRIAKSLYPDSDADPYFRARLDPTPANINSLVATIQRFLSQSEFARFGWSIQALGDFHKTEEVFAWLDRTPPAEMAASSYMLFRPGLAEVRRDRRFMAVAKRIGLLGYWRKSGEWPDFCSAPDLPYDCKKEAAKLAA